MNDSGPDTPFIPSQGRAKPVRDSRGRWVRQPVNAEIPARRDSVFDARIIEGDPPPRPTGHQPQPEGTGNALEFDFSVAASGEAADTTLPEDKIVDQVAVAEAPRPWAPPLPSWRIFSRPFQLLGGALLLLGVVFFVFQRGSIPAKRAELSTPPPPPAPVATVVTPPAPAQTGRRPAPLAVTAPPLTNNRQAAKTGAPTAVAPTARPAAPKPSAPAVFARTATPPPPGLPAAVATASDQSDGGASQSRSDEESWFNAAAEHLQRGEENRAEALYRRIYASGTQRGRAALALGDICARRNDFTCAQEHYRASKRFYQAGAPATSQP